jgi:hypothetical protein
MEQMQVPFPYLILQANAKVEKFCRLPKDSTNKHKVIITETIYSNNAH